MTDFLNSVKADLTDRRLLPIVALVVLALIGAIAYAALGGGGSTSTPTASAPVAPSVGTAGKLAVTATVPNKSVAETPDGSSQQRQGAARNPFTLLPGGTKTSTSAAKTANTGASTAATSKSSSSSSAKTESSSSTGSGSGGSTPSKPTTPSKPAAPQTVYHVAVLFGPVAPGQTPQTVQLTPFENIKLQTPLPSASQPLLVFRGVTLHGKSATFTLVGEAILHGNASCLPSASQCQAIDLQPGGSEQLEYLAPSGQITVYELRVVTITAVKASAAAVKSLLRSESKAGRELLRRAGLASIPYLHYSGQAGVLVFSTRGAFVAHAGRRHGG